MAEKAAAKLIAVVVLPTPPFPLSTTKIFVEGDGDFNDRLLECDGWQQVLVILASEVEYTAFLVLKNAFSRCRFAKTSKNLLSFSPRKAVSSQSSLISLLGSLVF